MTRSTAERMQAGRRRCVPAVLGGLVVAACAAAAPPVAESRCSGRGSDGAALVDADFRDAALAALERLAIQAPGQPADGAIRAHQTAAHLDAQGRAWHLVSAYAVNLGLLGALSTGPRVLPLAEAWLRWQARHVATQGALRGVVLDHWVRADTLEESTCPSGLPARLCSDTDAWDSTAASTLLVADAYQRAGGSLVLLREPAMRRLLEDAAAALARLVLRDELTIAKPVHPVVYTMDQVEVIAGRRAWARLQRDAYAQPASAVNTEALATAGQAAMRRHLALPHGAWSVSLGSGALQPGRWYADTVAQAWPLLWLPPFAQRDAAVANWQRAIAPWQPGRRGQGGAAAAADWTKATTDPDGFWWPAVAVAALCTGDEAGARAWVQRARQRWLQPDSPFAWPFQVSDLLWLLWMAEPSAAAAAAAATPTAPSAPHPPFVPSPSPAPSTPL